MPSILIDCQGLECPMPVVQVKQIIERNDGSDYTIIVDNMAAVENVSRLLRQHNFTITSSTKEKLWYITAHKNIEENSLVSPHHPEQPVSLAQQQQAKGEEKILLIITTEYLGNESLELGSKLLKNFLQTLPELGSSLWRICLINGGVRLATQDHPFLNLLNKLTKEGVSILVCGTCLEFFGLTSQRAIGETTNMLDIVTSMQVADKTIKI